ncbi:MAG: heavy-metal-associated domain-containing protein [Phyllobacterium sp.]
MYNVENGSPAGNGSALLFQVDDMTCGHCVGTIKGAIAEVAPSASVNIDLASHIVSVTGAADAAKIAEAITEAGYTPEAKA